MKIRQMQYFIEVCKQQSITKAAEILHVAQPSISAAIKDLEDELGINLFRRHNRKLFLTKEGEYVLSKVTTVVENIDHMMTDLLELGKKKHHISLGLPLQIGAYLMPIILGEFHDEYPEIEIEIVEVGGVDSVQLLEKEELDLTITALEDTFSSNLDCIHLFNTEYCFCVGKNHPLAKKDRVELSEIITEPLVMLKSGFLINKIVNRLYSSFGTEPNMLVYTHQLHTVKSLIASGIASSFLLKEAVIDDPEIVTIGLKEPLDVSICVVTKKGKQIYPDVKKLISFLKQEI